MRIRRETLLLLKVSPSLLIPVEGVMVINALGYISSSEPASLHHLLNGQSGQT